MQLRSRKRRRRSGSVPSSATAHRNTPRRRKLGDLSLAPREHYLGEKQAPIDLDEDDEEDMLLLFPAPPPDPSARALVYEQFRSTSASGRPQRSIGDSRQAKRHACAAAQHLSAQPSSPASPRPRAATISRPRPLRPAVPRSRPLTPVGSSSRLVPSSSVSRTRCATDIGARAPVLDPRLCSSTARVRRPAISAGSRHVLPRF